MVMSSVARLFISFVLHSNDFSLNCMPVVLFLINDYFESLIFSALNFLYHFHWQRRKGFDSFYSLNLLFEVRSDDNSGLHLQ